MTFRKTLIAAISALCLSSCSLFSPINANSETTYRLNSLPTVPIEKQSDKTLLVTQTDSIPMFNTKQMAYSNKPYQIGYFAKNHWAETPASMINNLMIQTLHNTHHYHAIISPPFTGKYDKILATQLIELQQDFNVNPSVIRLTARAQLIEASTSQILRAKEFSVVVPSTCNTPYGGVYAANKAVAKLLKEITQFCTG